MANKSVGQTKREAQTAKREALKNPYRYERADVINGNALSDIAALSESQSDIARSHTQALAPELVKRIADLFEKFPQQYEVLGLYFTGGFTVDEIARFTETTKGTVSVTLKRAVKRLKTKLTTGEYNRVRWYIGDVPPLQASPREDKSMYVNCRSRYVHELDWPVTVEGFEFKHPAPKDLLEPRYFPGEVGDSK